MVNLNLQHAPSQGWAKGSPWAELAPMKSSLNKAKQKSWEDFGNKMEMHEQEGKNRDADLSIEGASTRVVINEEKSIKYEEVARAILRIKNGMSAGEDRIKLEMFENAWGRRGTGSSPNNTKRVETERDSGRLEDSSNSTNPQKREIKPFAVIIGSSPC
ncbi:hypothetical protein ILUMI_22093 [Ignelater luminosus]|uniref:Uncharacterized protein n=1 Tax=Ignelater luminosus TaxID=2038154 RepID=A0A8K0CDD3_IGNLU|nr:hypothetical protein ILUMI_22093 [Ignelater luminosus]